MQPPSPPRRANAPVDPHLWRSVPPAATLTDIAKRVLALVVLSKHREGGLGHVFKLRKLVVTTKPKVTIYADNEKIGPTPATITAEVSALRVILGR